MGKCGIFIVVLYKEYMQMNTIVKNETDHLNATIEDKIIEYEKDLKNNKISWHSVDEMNAVINFTTLLAELQKGEKSGYVDEETFNGRFNQ